MIRRVYEAAGRGDFEAGFRDAHPDFEVTFKAGPNSGTHRGRDEIQAVFEDLLAGFDFWVMEPVELIEQDQRVVVIVNNRLRPKGGTGGESPPGTATSGRSATKPSCPLLGSLPPRKPSKPPSCWSRPRDRPRDPSKKAASTSKKESAPKRKKRRHPSPTAVTSEGAASPRTPVSPTFPASGTSGALRERFSEAEQRIRARRTARWSRSVLLAYREADLAALDLCIEDLVVESLRRAGLEEDPRADLLDDLVILRRL